MNTKRLLLLVCVVSSFCFAEDDKKPKGKPASDPELFLESTIVGDKEQPTVSYFIPWKGTGTPDNLHWNIEQKNDKTLDLIDREVMIRSISIYNELNMENIEQDK